MKFNSYIKVLHFVFDLLILISIIVLLIIDFIYYFQCCDIKNEIIPLLLIFFSFLLLLICFIMNLVNDYKNNLGFRSILRFITYCSLLIGFIFRKNNKINHYKYIYLFIGLFALSLLIINFLFGFCIGDGIYDREKITEQSEYSNFQIMLTDKICN